MVAREAAVGMHDDDIERRAAAGAEIEHALQFRPAIVHAARARLNELGGDAPAL